MRFRSVYGRLFRGFVVTLILSFGVTGFYAYRSLTSSAHSITEEDLQDSTTFVSDLLATDADEDTRERMLKEYADTSDRAFVIYDGTTEMTYGTMENTALLSDTEMNTLMNNPGAHVDMSLGGLYQYAESVDIDGTVYTIIMQKDVTASSNLFAEIYLISAIIMFLVGTIVFMIISDVIVRPIGELTKATNELSRGNYNVRVGYSGKDEIARLNDAFNQMAVQMAKQEETRQQFISDVSHEFQTPLTAMSGFATILRDENLTDEQRHKYADIIVHNAQRLSTLSKNMLQLTLLEGEDTKLEKTRFSLTDQLSRVVDMETAAAGARDIEIEFDCPKGDFEIEADEDRLEQVWMNLLSNAVKYTNPGGVVSVSVRRVMRDIDVKIEDTGVGMSQEALRHIYDRFYREDKSRSVQGNGLGLSIVKRILDLHGYTIDVVSQEDVGSVFTIHIPGETLGEQIRRIVVPAGENNS